MSKGNVAGVIGTGLRQFSGIDSVTDISGNNIQVLSSNAIVQGNTVGNPSLTLAGNGPINYTGGGPMTVNGKMFGGTQSVDMTPSTGSFNATFSGPFLTPVVVVVNWVKQGKEVTLHIPRIIGAAPFTAVGNATAPAGTIPPGLIPVNAGSQVDPTQYVLMPVCVFSANAIITPTGWFGIPSDGSILVFPANTSWANTGQNGWCATSMRYQTAN